MSDTSLEIDRPSIREIVANPFNAINVFGVADEVGMPALTSEYDEARFRHVISVEGTPGQWAAYGLIMGIYRRQELEYEKLLEKSVEIRSN